jgi:hypothetical protein
LIAYGEQALLMPDTGAANRRSAVEQFDRVFAPGNIVTLAHEAVRRLAH